MVGRGVFHGGASLTSLYVPAIFGFNANALAQGSSLGSGTSHVLLLRASTSLCFVAVPVLRGGGLLVLVGSNQIFLSIN